MVVSVEKAVPEQAFENESGGGALLEKPRRVPLWKKPAFWVAVFGCAAIALGVGLGVSLSNDEDRAADEARSSGLENCGGGGECNDSGEDGSGNVDVGSEGGDLGGKNGESATTLGPTLDPTTAPTRDPTSTPTEVPTPRPTPNPTEAPTSPGPTLSPTTALTSDPTSTPTKVPTADDGPGNLDDEPRDGPVIDAFQASFVSTGAFNVEIQAFNPSVLDGYEDCTDLEYDLTQALKLHANDIIERNKNGGGYWNTKKDAEVQDTVSTGAEEGSRESEAGGETDYRTNNQEENVDEADIVKSDGKYVYAAYGDLLLTWNATTGKVLSRLKMPPVGDEQTVVAQQKSMVVGGGGNSKPVIRSLLLHEDSERLVVVVTGYGPNWLLREGGYPILSDFGATQLRIFSTTTVQDSGSPTLLAVKDLQGNYQSGRSIASNGHIVTLSHVNSWYHFERHLARWQESYFGLNNTAYVAKATEIAEGVIDTFVDQLVNEMALDGSCSHIVQINVMQSTANDTNGSNTTEASMPPLFNEGILRSFAQVHSFDMAESHVNETVSTAVSGCYLPTWSAEVYASEEVLVLMGRGFRHDPITWTHSQSTFLLGFHLRSDGTSSPAAVGEVPGSLLNQFSVDHHGEYLRVATTIREQWGRANVTNSDGSWEWDWVQLRDNQNQVVVLRFPTLADDETTGVFEEVGRLDQGLGHPGERLYAVRFLDDVGYVVTFRQTDPFYTLDLTDPVNPTIVGELNITGFSNYLHPINDDLVLAVGQEADSETGRPMGFQISLFDVSDLTSPRLESRYVVPQKSEDFSSSSSQAQYDHKAFRYLQQTKVLIVPLSQWQWGAKDGNFDGFVVYNISEEEITPRFNISHADPYGMSYWCWYPAYLAPRSMVFNGDLTTMKGHAVMSHDLGTGEYLWEANLDENVTKDDCHGYWL